MTNSPTYRQRVVELARARGEFIRGGNGYFVFCPSKSHGGAYGSRDLRILVDELDEMNRDWKAQVARTET